MEDREDANALDLRVFLRLAWARKTSPSPLRQTDPANHLHGPGHNSLPLSLWRTFFHHPWSRALCENLHIIRHTTH